MDGQMSLFDAEPEGEEDHVVLTQEIKSIELIKDRDGLMLPDLLPSEAQITLTKNYGVRSDLMSRILKSLIEKEDKGQRVTREEIGMELAIPSERREGAFMVGRKAELITSVNKPTKIARLLIKYDPYLLDNGSLCILHYLLASNANLIIWSHLFNSVFFEYEDIEPNQSIIFFDSLSERWSEKTIKTKAKRELGGILRTYADEFFKPLDLVTRIRKGHYAPNSNSVVIPSWIWLSILLLYRDRYYPGAKSLEIGLIINANFCPGRLFRLNENTIRNNLDLLHNKEILTVETRSGLDQVRFKDDHTWLSAISEYFLGEE
jgi:hypothetical protein